MEKVLFLAHDWDLERAEHYPGLLRTVFSDWGWDIEVRSFFSSERTFVAESFDFLVVLGAAESVDDNYKWMDEETEFILNTRKRGIPILGICFGAQLLASIFGGSVYRLNQPELGFTEISTTAPLFIDSGPWLQIHGDGFKPPSQSSQIAENSYCSQAFLTGGVLGVQFHPEMDRGAFEALMEEWDETGAGGMLQKFDLSASEILERIDSYRDQWITGIKSMLTRFLTLAWSTADSENNIAAPITTDIPTINLHLAE